MQIGVFKINSKNKNDKKKNQHSHPHQSSIVYPYPIDQLNNIYFLDSKQAIKHCQFEQRD